MQSSRTLFENAEMAATLPTAGLSGCGFGSLRCETNNTTNKDLYLKSLRMTLSLDTCPDGGTCPLLKHTCVSLRVGDERQVGGKRKTKPAKSRKQMTTSKKDATYLRICHLTMLVTCIAVSLDQLEPKEAHDINF